MRRLVLSSCCLFVAGAAFGQAKKETTTTTTKESTTVTTTTKKVATESGWDLTTELWNITDATPVPHGQIDLRFTVRWIPEPPDSSEQDDFIFQPSIVWGVFENVETSINVPIWFGDGEDRGNDQDGNYDTNWGALWRFYQGEGYWPAMALASTVRIPTGEGSDKLDAELRLALTNEYDSGLRSHVNGWLKTVNGTNNDTSPFIRNSRIDDTFDDRGPNDTSGYTRDFQWGVGVGLDGAMPRMENVRWVLDCIYRSSETNGENDIVEAEGGFEWQVADNQKVGLSAKANLDHGNNDIAPYAASFTYAISLKK